MGGSDAKRSRLENQVAARTACQNRQVPKSKIGHTVSTSDRRTSWKTRISACDSNVTPRFEIVSFRNSVSIAIFSNLPSSFWNYPNTPRSLIDAKGHPRNGVRHRHYIVMPPNDPSTTSTCSIGQSPHIKSSNLGFVPRK